MSLSVPLNLTETNGYYTIVVPNSGFQNTISVDLAGAGGGGGGNYYGAAGSGSNGYRYTGNLTVNPGDVITVYVGGGGGAGGAAAQNSNAGGSGGPGAIIGDISGDGTVYPVSLSYAWSQWMNAYAVWVNPDQVNPVGQWVSITRTVYFPTGLYRFYAEADNLMNVYVDGNLLYSTPDDHTFDIYQNGVEPTGYLQISEGFHTMRFDVYNEGGPAGFAFQWQNDAIANSVHWSTRTNLSGNSYRYIFTGGNGGNTYGDGSYVYPAPGGGGGASAIFVNGNLAVVAGGGGGGGSEGGHGAGGGNAVGAGSVNPDGTGHGQDGSDGYDVAGTPGGGGGWQGGAAGGFIYYDDAPSSGASAGTSNALLGSGWSLQEYSSSAGGPSSNGADGYATITFNRLGAGNIKIDNNWKPIQENWVKVDGVWKVITGAWIKINGSWKLINSNTTIPVTFKNQTPTNLSAYIQGFGSGGGGPNTNPGTQYSLDGNSSYYIQSYVPVSRHYIANSTGDSRFSANRALAFRSPGSNISDQQLANWGFDPSDVVAATNIRLLNLTGNVDSYLGIGYAILNNGATDFSQAHDITRLAYASDPAGDRHYHNVANDATPSPGPWNIPDPGPDELIYIWINDGSGSDSMTITVSCVAG